MNVSIVSAETSSVGADVDNSLPAASLEQRQEGLCDRERADHIDHQHLFEVF